MSLRDRLAALIAAPAYRPLDRGEIARQLGLAADERFARLFEALEADAVLLVDARGLVHRWDGDRWTAGTLRMDSDGRYVVRAGRGDEGAGFVIHDADRADARPGDLVAVERTRARAGGAPAGRPYRGRGAAAPPAAGRVLKVLRARRGAGRLVGVIERDGARRSLVQFDGLHARALDLDPREAARLPAGAVVEIDRIERPADRPRAQARGVTVVGDILDPAFDLDVIRRAHGLPDRFPRAVMREAAAAPDQWSPAGRRDLRDHTVITIDPADAKDFDDAVSVETRAGGWRLGVHIADVAHFVPPGSALDQEARERGTSVYLPGTVIPMLPPRLSNHLCSLKPDEPRYTLSAFLDFDAEGRRTGARLARTLIRSCRRFTYEEVQSVFEGRARPAMPAAVGPLLEALRALAERLRARRIAEGALMLDVAKVRVRLGPDQRVRAIEPERQDLSHHVIEECMLAANQAVAEYMIAHEVPYIARAHEPPRGTDLDDLFAFLDELGYRGERGPPALAGVIAWAQGRRDRACVHMALLRSLSRADYRHARIGHFALRRPLYTHFTSPIRRYPDLMVHQLLTQQLAGALDRAARTEWELALPERCAHASFTERRADDAERDLTKLKILRLLEDQVGDDCWGTITGITHFGVFVELDEYRVDGLVRLGELGRGKRLLTRFSVRLATRRGAKTLRVGDRLPVLIARVDVVRRELDLTPL